MKTTFVAVLMLFTSAAASAACDSATTQAALTACSAEQYAAQDKKLNTTYNAYRQRLDASQKKQLTDAQLAWIKYRDLSCTFESASVAGGSAYSMVRNGCLAAKTADRIKEI